MTQPPRPRGARAAARQRLAAILVAVLAGCGGCDKAANEASEAATAAARRTEEGVRPVYTTTGKADARAAQLCQALHALPEARRAACCAGRAGVVLAEACTGVLSAALGSEAVALDSTRLAACTAALERAYAGCAWVGPFGPPLPTECAGLFTGRRAAGEACNSSLECTSDLVCAGAGPTDRGRCAPSGQKGASCGTAVDALASYTRQDADALHPPCQGLCRRHVCETAAATGEACQSSQNCRLGQHCATGRCAEGLAEKGQRCSGGDCAAGLRCLGGSCAEPSPLGAVCTSDLECAAGCVQGAEGGHCGLRCELR